MAIEPDEVRHIATLARLRFSSDEEAAFGGSLSAILDYVKQLEEVDTSDVVPTTHAVHLDMNYRDDIVTPPLSKEAVLGNAPVTDDGQFCVPKVVEGS